MLSKIENGKFVPAFGQPGKPFVCFQANPLPDKLQSKPTLKGVSGGLGRPEPERETARVSDLAKYVIPGSRSGASSRSSPSGSS